MPIVVHPDDQEQIDDLRRDLLGWRTFLGKPQRVLALEAGIPEVWAGCIERGEQFYLKLPAICKYAQVFRTIVEVGLHDIAAAVSPEISSLENLVDAQPYNGGWLDSLTMAVLKQARLDLDIPAHMMAAKLDMRVDKFEVWESSAEDPLLVHLMCYARELGGRLTLRLVKVRP